MIRRGDVTDIAWGLARLEIKCLGKFRGPASSQLYISGGVHGKFFFTSVILQLLPLATFKPRLVQVGQCAWELGLTNSRK